MQTYRFDQIAENINERVMPDDTDLDRYVGLEHLDPESLKIRRWGSPADVIGQKLRFWEGDIIFGRRRAYQRKLAVADFDGICSAHAMVLRAKTDMVLPEFLPFFLQSDLFMNRAIEISVGSLSPTINWRTLAEQEFPLPPIDEQRRIADLLWAADDALQRTIELANSSKILLKASIDDAANTAIERSAHVPLNELIIKGRPITYGILKPGTGYLGGIPVIKVKDYPNGEIKQDNLLLTSPRIEAEYKRSRLKSGDLLISIRGTIGRLAYVPKELDGSNITQDTARLSLIEDVNHDFVRFMLESSYVQRQIKSKITGMAVQGINIGELRKIEIPLLERKEQNLLAGRIHGIRQAIKEIELHTEKTSFLRKQFLENTLQG